MMTDGAIVALVVGVLTVIGWIIKNVFNAISANTIRVAQLEVKIDEVEKNSASKVSVAQLEVKMDDVEKSYTRTELFMDKLSGTIQSMDRMIHKVEATVESLDKRRRSTDQE